MKSESTIRTAIGLFLMILVGALVSALLGGLFGALVALISPEFVSGLFHRAAEDALGRYAFAVGMIWGLFIGAIVSGFAALLAAVIKVVRVRLEYKRDHDASR